MVRRSRLEMRIDVLKVISGGTQRITDIMYETKTNYKTIKSLLGHLVRIKLIAGVPKEGGSIYYNLTRDGYNNIKIAELLIERISEKKN